MSYSSILNKLSVFVHLPTLLPFLLIIHSPVRICLWTGLTSWMHGQESLGILLCNKLKIRVDSMEKGFFECDILTNAVWQCTRMIILPGHCWRPSSVTMALAHHRLLVQILKSFPADASVPEFFNWFFPTEKWIRNEDLISVLKRTESVQLWLKMSPTPKSGPSRHSLAATTTSYIEILILLLRLHWETPMKSTFLPAVQVRLWTGLSPLPMSNPSLHWYLIVVPGTRYLWSKPASAPTRPK